MSSTIEGISEAFFLGASNFGLYSLQRSSFLHTRIRFLRFSDAYVLLLSLTSSAVFRSLDGHFRLLFTK